MDDVMEYMVCQFVKIPGESQADSIESELNVRAKDGWHLVHMRHDASLCVLERSYALGRLIKKENERKMREWGEHYKEAMRAFAVLSPRVRNLLARTRDYFNFAQLYSATDAELLEVHNLGPKGLAEIRAATTAWAQCTPMPSPSGR